VNLCLQFLLLLAVSHVLIVKLLRVVVDGLVMLVGVCGISHCLLRKQVMLVLRLHVLNLQSLVKNLGVFLGYHFFCLLQ